MDPVYAGGNHPKVHTAPEEAKARVAVVAAVDDDLETLLDTALSKLWARMEATFLPRAKMFAQRDSRSRSR
jgi:hypothetical protein